MSLESIFIIPARKGSKGFPHKNRVLFDFTARSLASLPPQSIIVSTDDSVIKTKALEFGFYVHDRSEKNSDDFASVKQVIVEVVEDFDLDKKLIHVLYLTYPERNLNDIEKARLFLENNGATSLLCRKKTNSHPYLCFESLPNHKAKPVIEHTLYRRQDYPECFEVSHFISIFSTEELNKLSDQLYNENTIFYSIEDKIDVDHEEDFLKYGS